MPTEESPSQLLPWMRFGVIAGLAGIYYLLGFHTPRTETTQLFVLFAGAFLGYGLLLRYPVSLSQGIGASLLFRLILLLATPALSDDYFRFVWDGLLVMQGENPYLHLPTHYLQNPAAGLEFLHLSLFQNLNSPQYYSVYPPVCQFIFGLAALLSPQDLLGSVLVMRLVLLGAEGGTVWLLTRLLPLLGLPKHRLLWYALNPLVILEVTGNLHFEGLLLFFLVGALYLLVRQRLGLSAIFFGLAVGVKLVPLMFLPFLFGKLRLRQLGVYYGVVAVTLLVLFLPFLSEDMVRHLFTSIFLYFHTFEFNAGIYYAARWVGTELTGKNLIGYITSLLSLLTVAGVLRLAWLSRRAPISSLPLCWLLSLALYLLLNTTVHPWYLVTLVALSVGTSFRFPVVWSGLVLLSYATYRDQSYSQPFGLIALEYAVVLAWLWYEWYKEKAGQGK